MNDNYNGVIARNEVTKQSRQYYVYFMVNKIDSTIYVGVTNDLVRRVYEHKNQIFDGFSKKYNITKLVYYEMFEDIQEAIKREKQIKGGSRQRKIDLINSMNISWKDLYDEIV